ncbi:MAG: helix-turn-helix domain-containing protein [Acidimicrobiales bacterium]|nr:helix-turn-helix domain-containing protein [Acidimicrobiales bacterium]
MDGLGPQPVPALLSPYVRSVVSYDLTGAPGIHRGLPSTGLTIVFPLDVPIAVGWTDSSVSADWSTVGGLHTRPARIHHDGRQRGIQATLTVAGSRCLLGMPASELVGQIITVDALSPSLRELPERLHAEDTWAGRIEILQRVLVGELARHEARGPRAEVGRALARLTTGAPVSGVAADVGFSRRRLSTVVREETGVTPKQFARLARFERTKRLLVTAYRDGGPTIAAVAAEGGYADHAHLTREWNELAGCPPGLWVEEEFPNVQASLFDS